VIVDTGQTNFYNATGSVITTPLSGGRFYGQDASYTQNSPSYTDNGDGTVTDLRTGLMWQQDPGSKMSYASAVSGATIFSLAGYTDWRLPTIKELYSLILFSGGDPSAYTGTDTTTLTPFIDTNYFSFEYGDTSIGDRIIDAQYVSSTEYVDYTMDGDATIFGVNFADGRIKGYPKVVLSTGADNTFFVKYVRSNTDYGINNFSDNGDLTITDAATGLTWMQIDSGHVSANSASGSMNWEDALSYCEDLSFAGKTNWRLPNAKELESIIDYTRSPVSSGSPAINLLFSSTTITNEGGLSDYPYYWSSTTHSDYLGNGSAAAYLSFGRALGYMNGSWKDVHGAGAQRSDPKTGSAADYPTGHGPQGDAIRILNYVRCVS